MANLEELLKKVSEIVVREKTQQEEKRKRGENFNIFKVLGLSTSEVRLHSAFLAELLNPNGDHGLGDKFMKAFVDGVIQKQRDSFVFDSASAQVFVEYPVGTVSNEYDKGGRIDILIQDKNKQTIVIENKIYAGDQPLQMYRYNRYLTEEAKLKPSQYVLLYLSLEEGDQPSEESTGKNPSFDFYCINYRNDIINWLNECIGKAALYPAVRETISQYIINLKQLLNIMSDNSNKAILDILLEESNIEATLSICSLASKIGVKIRENFINNRIKKLVEKYNLQLSYDDKFSYLPSGEKKTYNGIRVNFSQYPNIYIKIEQWSNEVYYGIVVENLDDKDKIIMGRYDDWNNGTPSGTWPYGSKTFPENLKYWDGIDSLSDMVKGDKIITIIDKELRRVLDNQLIEKLNAKIDRKNR